MDLGVPEPAAHILSNDRKWDDVKQLQLVDLPFVLANLNLTSTVRLVSTGRFQSFLALLGVAIGAVPPH